MIYNIVLTGHLLRVFKLAGWPDTVVYNHMVEANNFSKLQEAVDFTISGIIKQGGFLHFVESNKPLDDTVETLNRREYIPMHMLSHITTEIKHLSGPLPTEQDRVN